MILYGNINKNGNGDVDVRKAYAEVDKKYSDLVMQNNAELLPIEDGILEYTRVIQGLDPIKDHDMWRDAVYKRKQLRDKKALMTKEFGTQEAPLRTQRDSLDNVLRTASVRK